MTQRVRLGMLTPSSNTVLEPLTQQMIAGLPEVSAHFSRFRVTQIGLSDEALSQFDQDQLVSAAELLADAKVDVIAWNGTSAGWLGFDADRQLCEQITHLTGIPTTTSVLAILDIFQQLEIKHYALITPYLGEVQEKIIAHFAEAGYECVAEQHLSLSNNFSFSEVEPERLRFLLHQVAAHKPQVMLTFCTNLWAAPLATMVEQEMGIPMVDTVAIAVWKSLILAGVDPSRVKGWGSIFQEEKTLFSSGAGN